MSYWYVIKVLPGKERQIQDHFNKEILTGELKKIKRFVCPIENNTIFVKNKKTIRESVIYTGYLYFESEDKLTDGDLKHIGSNNMIMGFLGDRKPVLLNKNDVSKILIDENLDEHNESKKYKFKIGEEVKITQEDFKGFVGTIKELKDDIVQVEVKIFGVGSKIKLKTTEISKI
jgi:transcription termination/antitermination protein NusG